MSEIVLYCCCIRMKEVIRQRAIKMKRAVDEATFKLKLCYDRYYLSYVMRWYKEYH